MLSFANTIMATVRSDIKIGNLEKKLGLPKGTIRNPDGSDARSDKRLRTLREDYERMYAGPPVRVSASMKATVAAVKKVAAKKAKAAGLPASAVRPATVKATTSKSAQPKATSAKSRKK